MSKLVTPFGFESTALVTGASSGIGYETARALASVGAAVVVAARRDRAGACCPSSVRHTIRAGS